MTSTIQYSPLSWGVLSIEGIDAEKFLQGQLTCDVRLAAPRLCTLGAHCTPQGRVLATFYLARYANHFELYLPATVRLSLLNTLKKYAVFSKVSLIDMTGQLSIYGVIGEPLAAKAQGEYAIISIDGGRFIRMPSSTPRYLFIGATGAFDTLVKQSTTEFEHQPESLWQQADIDAAIPLIEPATQGLFTPHDLNLPTLGGVSFEKGCYTGQEIIARMQHRGKPKYGLYRATIDGSETPKPGDALSVDRGGEEKAGTVINAYGQHLLVVIAHTHSSLFWNGYGLRVITTI